MKRLYIIFLLFSFSSVLCQTQESKYLLLNAKVQYESTGAINALYNFKFDVAEKRFNWMIQEYPEHPLPYYLMGLSAWWKIMPNDAVKDYDEAFFKYMDLSIEKAKKLYDEDKDNREAKFFLASAYGLKARFHSDRDSYTKAAFATKKALSYLNKVEVGNDDLDPEFLLGDALYNYFREWIPENKPGLKPIVMFFSKGNKELGMEQLKTVSNESFYTRIEAMNFMILIYEYEKTAHLALPIAKYLYETYPDNSFFQRKYAKLNYLYGNSKVTAAISKDYLRKYHANYPGYEAVGARYSSYFIAETLINADDAVEEINKKIISDNKALKKLNKSKKKSKSNTKKYNAYSTLINASIRKKNAEIDTENTLIQEGEINPALLKYNKKVANENKKIQKTNAIITAYNKKLNKDSNKMMRLYKKWKMQGSFAGKIEYQDSTEYYLKQTIEFGNQLNYQDKNYHINSLHYLAQISLDKKDEKTAAVYYKTILAVAPKKNILRRVAKNYLKTYNPS